MTPAAWRANVGSVLNGPRDATWIDLLVELAGDETAAVADAVAGMVMAPSLDPTTALQVRLAALFALRCDLQSTVREITHSVETGMAPEDLQLMLEAIAPVIGSDRTQRAAAQLAMASEAGFS
jgi:hypothetical protein